MVSIPSPEDCKGKPLLRTYKRILRDDYRKIQVFPGAIFWQVMGSPSVSTTFQVRPTSGPRDLPIWDAKGPSLG